MTPSGSSYTDLQLGRTLFAVELEPSRRVWHVTPNCGPDGDRVMVSTYQEHGSHFVTPGEARDIARALISAAEETEALADQFREALERERSRPRPVPMPSAPE